MVERRISEEKKNVGKGAGIRTPKKGERKAEWAKKRDY